MTDEDVRNLIFTKPKKQRIKSEPFWKAICNALSFVFINPMLMSCRCSSSPAGSACHIQPYPQAARSSHAPRSVDGSRGSFVDTVSTQLCCSSISHLTYCRNVEKLGLKWSQISKRIGRDPETCRARYVDHLRDRDVRLEGKCWPLQALQSADARYRCMDTKRRRPFDSDC